MASTINPSSIDATYPVAGVDNDSQGFRDNFAAIKTNFTTAKSEIDALQSGTAKLNSSNDFNGSLLQDAELKEIYQTAYNLGSSATGTLTLSFVNGGYQFCTTTGSVTLAFASTWPTTGKYAELLFEVNLTSGHTITLPSSCKTPTGFTMPTATGKHLLKFATRDGGTNILTTLVGSTFA